MLYRLMAVLAHNLFAFSWYIGDNYPPFSLHHIFSHLEKYLFIGETQNDQKVGNAHIGFSTPSPKLCTPLVFLTTSLTLNLQFTCLL